MRCSCCTAPGTRDRALISDIRRGRLPSYCPQIRALHVLVLHEARTFALQSDAAVLQDIAVFGKLERLLRILLDQQDGDPLPIELLHDGEDLLDQQRGEAERGLVEKEEPRPRHEAPSNPEHSL